MKQRRKRATAQVTFHFARTSVVVAERAEELEARSRALLDAATAEARQC